MKKSIHSEQGKALREWLRKSRLEAKLTMRELGERLGVPFQFISKVEKGERRLDVVEFVTYCQAMGVDAQQGIALLTHQSPTD